MEKEQKFINITNLTDCTGCRACEQICPKNCIEMVENEEGFLYPKVNEEQCINCGLCKKTCHIQNAPSRAEFFEKSEVYAMKPKTEEVAINSTSGGMFVILAKYILSQNGIIYGCEFDENLIARHIAIDSIKELNKLRGSKYVSSNTLSTYKEVKENLKNNKLVLYTGTPCQIAGLKKFLNHEYDKLITVDIVCHGVPSQKLFSTYIEWLENKLGDKIKTYEFRNKEKSGWGLGFTAKIVTQKDKVKYLKADFDPYYSAFLSGKTYRESCYQCKYANIERIGDFTIADFWGIEKIKPKFYSKDGISLVVINNQKAKDIFEKMSADILLEKTNIDDAIVKNHNLKEPTKRLNERNDIYSQIQDFESCANTYMLPKNKVKTIIKNSIPQSFKIFIKKYL